jgi:hypothetical protein
MELKWAPFFGIGTFVKVPGKQDRITKNLNPPYAEIYPCGADY